MNLDIIGILWKELRENLVYNSAPKIIDIIWYRLNYSKFNDHFYEQLMTEFIQNELDEFAKKY